MLPARLIPTFVLLASACGGPPAVDSSPRTTLAALAEAVERETGEGVAANRFVVTPGDRAALAASLRDAELELWSLVTVGSTEAGARTVVLVEENGELRVDSGILGLPALDTPERAIAALHRALTREIGLGVGPLLAEAQRRAWLEERARYRDGTSEPEALDVRVDGDGAVATTPLGDEIRLVREGGEWRVVSMRAAGLD